MTDATVAADRAEFDLRRKELDRRQRQIRKRFPGGVPYDAFVLLTLETARDDGRVWPPSMTNFFWRHSALTTMWLRDKIIDQRGRHDEPIRYYINDRGRAHLAAATTPAASLPETPEAT